MEEKKTIWSFNEIYLSRHISDNNRCMGFIEKHRLFDGIMVSFHEKKWNNKTTWKSCKTTTITQRAHSLFATYCDGYVCACTHQIFNGYAENNVSEKMNSDGRALFFSPFSIVFFFFFSEIEINTVSIAIQVITFVTWMDCNVACALRILTQIQQDLWWMCEVMLLFLLLLRLLLLCWKKHHSVVYTHCSRIWQKMLSRPSHASNANFIKIVNTQQFVAYHLAVFSRFSSLIDIMLSTSFGRTII